MNPIEAHIRVGISICPSRESNNRTKSLLQNANLSLLFLFRLHINMKEAHSHPSLPFRQLSLSRGPPPKNLRPTTFHILELPGQLGGLLLDQLVPSPDLRLEDGGGPSARAPQILHLRQRRGELVDEEVAVVLPCVHRQAGEELPAVLVGETQQVRHLLLGFRVGSGRRDAWGC